MRGEVDMAHEVNRDSVEFHRGRSTRSQLYSSIQPVLHSARLQRSTSDSCAGRSSTRAGRGDQPRRNRRARRCAAGQVADDPIWPSHWAYNPRRAPLPVQPGGGARAAGRGRPSGSPGGSGPEQWPAASAQCVFWNDDPQFERIALLLQRQLADVGVDLVLEGATREGAAGTTRHGQFRHIPVSDDQRPIVRLGLSLLALASAGCRGIPEHRVQRRGRRAGSPAHGRRSDDEIRTAIGDLRQRFYEDAPAAFLAWTQVTRAVDARFDVGDRSRPRRLREPLALAPADARVRADERDHRPLRPAHRHRRRPAARGLRAVVGASRCGRHRAIGQPRQPGGRQADCRHRSSCISTTTFACCASIGTELHGTQLEPWQQERILRNHVLDFPEFREISVFDASGRVRATQPRRRQPR